MTSLYVLYGQPADAAAFQDYFVNTHLPLVETLPGQVQSGYALDLRGPDGSPGETFAVFRADFADPAELGAALSSPEGGVVAADVANYATGGATILVGESIPFISSADRAVRRYLDGWNNHDVDGILDCFAPDGVYTDPATDGEIGLVALREHLGQLFNALPDLHLEITDVEASGQGGLAFWRGTGAGGALDFLGADKLRFDSAYRITWTAALYDQEAFKNQLAASSAR